MSEPPLLPGIVTVAAAQAAMRKGAMPIEAETVSLNKALGRVLAQPVIATRHQPPFNASAMDGYAVRLADLKDQTEPVTLTVIGHSVAGRRFDGAVAPGQAVRIFTGAPVPSACDAVIIQENTRADGEHVTISVEGLRPKSVHVRPAGQDFAAGDVLVKTGVRLDPWRLSLVAAAGCDTIGVVRRPRICVLSTGDELVLPGRTPRADQIFESASHALMGLIKQWGGKASFVGVGKDKTSSLLRAIKTAKADLIVTIGGASVGDHDLVKSSLAELGLVLDFDGVRVRPGKPTAFGVLKDGRRVLSLPGNPASAFVVAQLLLKTWIEASLGMRSSGYIKAAATRPIPANGPREAFLRGLCRLSAHSQMQVSPFADQDSSLVSVFARADALIRLPPNALAVAKGDLVDILPLDRL